MNINTLLKLSKNPHYKLSRAQQKMLDEYEAQKEKEPMVTFGKPKMHNQTVPTHPQLQRKQNGTA